MNINKLIDDTNCHILKCKTKTEAILEIIDLVEDSGSCSDIENLKKEIFYREQIMSTGIGQGIGIPHVRLKGIEKPIIFVALSHTGITDYESLDNETVKIVIMILVGVDQHKEYLRILSLIVRKIKDKDFKESLLKCNNNKEISAIFKNEEM